VDPSILSFSIPKLTLQPIIENAIYHGLKIKKEKGLIKITGYKHQNNVVIEVYDNGVGMSQTKIEEVLTTNFETSGDSDFGLYSIISRLSLLYGDAYGLTIESTEKIFTKVIINIPAEREDNTC